MRIIFPLLCVLLGGCLKPDATNPTTGDDAFAVPKDLDRRAGASSSTNWPTKSGDIPIRVTSVAGPNFFVAFSKRGTSALDSVTHPVKVGGKISIYNSGIIPALDSSYPVSFVFSESDTVLLPDSLLNPLFEKGQDTLFFNLHFESDTLQAWAFGFAYSRSTKTFSKTPYSYETGNFLYLLTPTVNFKGVLDTVGGLPKASLSGKTHLCFYIPGTSYFWKAATDTLVLGPLPDGDYPLRLLRVTYAGEKVSGTEVEVFEVNSMAGTVGDEFNRIKPEASVLTFRAQTNLSLRPFGSL